MAGGFDDRGRSALGSTMGGRSSPPCTLAGVGERSLISRMTASSRDDGASLSSSSSLTTSSVGGGGRSLSDPGSRGADQRTGAARIPAAEPAERERSGDDERGRGSSGAKEGGSPCRGSEANDVSGCRDAEGANGAIGGDGGAGKFAHDGGGADRCCGDDRSLSPGVPMRTASASATAGPRRSTPPVPST